MSFWTALLGNNEFNDGVRTGYMLAINQLRAAQDMIYNQVMSVPGEHDPAVHHMLTMMDTLEAASNDFEEYFDDNLRDL